MKSYKYSSNPEMKTLLLEAITVPQGSVWDMEEEHRDWIQIQTNTACDGGPTTTPEDFCARSPLYGAVAGIAWAFGPPLGATSCLVEVDACGREEIENLDALNGALVEFRGRTVSYGGNSFLPRFLLARMRLCGVTPNFDVSRFLARHVDLADLLKADPQAPTPPLRSVAAAVGLGWPTSFLSHEVAASIWRSGDEDPLLDDLVARTHWLAKVYARAMLPQPVEISSKLATLLPVDF